MSVGKNEKTVDGPNEDGHGKERDVKINDRLERVGGQTGKDGKTHHAESSQEDIRKRRVGIKSILLYRITIQNTINTLYISFIYLWITIFLYRLQSYIETTCNMPQ